jgi:hypothetical protein
MAKRKTTPRTTSPMWLRLHRLAYVAMICSSALLIGLYFIAPPTPWGVVRGIVVFVVSAGYWLATRRRAAELDALARIMALPEVVTEP